MSRTSRPVRPTGEFRGNGRWISVSSLSWMSGEEGPVSLSVPGSPLSWMSVEEGHVSLSVPPCLG